VPAAAVPLAVTRGRQRSRILWSELLVLRQGSEFTLQDELRSRLIAAITSGRVPPDQPLPSSRNLAQQLGIGRNTVVIVYQQLADDGYVTARRRQGYYPNLKSMARRTGENRDEPPREREPDWLGGLQGRPSLQRHISKARDWHHYEFPFIYGQPDRELFPINEWRACCQQVLSRSDALDWAQDRFSADDPSLLEQIREKVLPLRGIWASSTEILVTIGAQHALYLLADLLVDGQTPVGFENPGYPDARHIFSRRTSQMRPLALDDQGLVLSEALSGCRVIYATPSHQSPTAVTMPIERRLAFLQRAESDNFLIIEDDYETEVSFRTLPNPALKSLDRNNRVVYVGSLTKSLAPGLRLGYIVAPAALITELRALRRLMIRHPTAFIERSFARFLALGHFDAFNRRLADAYRERASLMTQAIAQCLPDCRHAPVTGGSSFWLMGPAWLDARRLADLAAAERVLIEPGDVHFAEKSPPLNFFRLGFSSIESRSIPEGIRRLGDLIARQRSCHPTTPD
jgi:GntR family transcriptional regulator/MocR family aminotransferase